MLAVVVPALLHGAYDYIATTEDLSSSWSFVIFIVLLFIASYRLVSRASAEDRYRRASRDGEPEDGHSRSRRIILGIAHTHALNGGKGDTLQFGGLSPGQNARGQDDSHQGGDDLFHGVYLYNHTKISILNKKCEQIDRVAA